MRQVAAVVVAGMLAACGGSSTLTTGAPAPAPTAPALPSATTAASPPATTSPAAAGTSTTAPATTPPPVAECPPPVPGVTGDFDGDGAADTAYVADLVLVACLADGSVSTLDVGGMGEVLLAVDLQGDGIDEILAGGTTAWGQGADVGVIVDGELAAVSTGGARLQLWRGIPPDGVLEFGCADEDGDGRREVILVEGEVAGGEVAVQRRAVAIDGATATELSVATAVVPLTGSPDVLSEPGIRELAGAAC